MLIYPIGTTDACRQACSLLHKQGFRFTDHPCPEITHLLLDVPSFRENGDLRGGGSLAPILSMVPQRVHIIGGNLDIPLLQDYTKADLLLEPVYLAHNARITADCALRLAAQDLNRTFTDSPALVIGWGRIGKCLAQMLHAIGCPVTVAARKETDRAMIGALGCDAISTQDLTRKAGNFHLIFNTVPADLPDPVPAEDAFVYELASVPGLPVTQAISARGLPGKMAPFSSGQLIAETICRLYKEEKL